MKGLRKFSLLEVERPFLPVAAMGISDFQGVAVI